MNRKLHIAVNIIGFQIGWFSCVLMAAQNQPMIGVAVALAIIFLHLWLSDSRQNDISVIILVTLIGTMWDSLLTTLNILEFNTGQFVSYLAPYWIIAMWALFATTLTVSLKWLFGYYWIALSIGTIAGPVAYIGGSALGGVVIPDMIIAIWSLAIGWAFLLPLCIQVAEFIQHRAEVRLVEK